VPSVFILSIVVIKFNRLEPFSEDNRSDLKQLAEIRASLPNDRDLYFSLLYFNCQKNDLYKKVLKLDCYSIGKSTAAIYVIYIITEEIGPFKHQFELKKIPLSVVRKFNQGIYNS